MRPSRSRSLCDASSSPKRSLGHTAQSKHGKETPLILASTTSPLPRVVSASTASWLPNCGEPSHFRSGHLAAQSSSETCQKSTVSTWLHPASPCRPLKTQTAPKRAAKESIEGPQKATGLLWLQGVGRLSLAPQDECCKKLQPATAASVSARPRSTCTDQSCLVHAGLKRPVHKR